MPHRMVSRTVAVALVALLLVPAASLTAQAALPAPGSDAVGTRTVGGYRTFEEVVAELRDLVAAHPDILSIMDLGAVFPNGDGSPKTTWEGRKLWAVKLSDNPHINESSEPKVLYTGAHHAREWITVEAVMYALNRLVDHYGNNATVTTLVDSVEMWFVPVVNPDGFIYTQEVEWPDTPDTSMWRKNMRDNGDGTKGVDLNRNYGYAWGYSNQGSSQFPADVTYRGPAPFSEPETQIIRDLGEAIHFAGAISWHSYSEVIGYPWSHIQQFTPHNLLFKELGRRFAQYNGYDYGCWRDGILYEVNGDFTEWFYANTSCLAFTIEISPAPVFIPPEEEILHHCQINYEPFLILARWADDYYRMFNSGVRCTVQDPRGNPLSGVKVHAQLFGDDSLDFVTGPDGTFSFRAPRDVEYGVTVEKEGYSNKTEYLEPIWQDRLTDFNITIRDIVPPVISRVVASHEGAEGRSFGVGETVRIDVFESQNETGLSGTVSITNPAINYFHMRRALTYDPAKRSYYYVWNTRDLQARADYLVTTELWDIDMNKDSDGVVKGKPDVVIELRDITPPMTPLNLSVTAPLEGGRLVITWDVNRDDTQNYTIARKVGQDGDWAFLINVSVTQTQLIDQGLENGVTYYYRLMAWDEVPLPSPWSFAVSGIPLDKVPPGPVRGLVITAPHTGGRLELRWTESTDDTATYVLLRDAGDGFETLAQLPRGTTFYEDSALENGRSYLYKIYALDMSLNEGPISDAVIGLPQDIVPPPVPTIEPLPELTNKLRLQVRGTGEPLALIDVQVNGQVVTGEDGFAVDADGNWSGTIDLVPKENRVRVKARDVAGNPSGLTPESLVFVDVTAPTVTYQAPVPGQAAVPVDQVVELTFTEVLVQSSVSVRLEYEPGGEVSTTFTYDDQSRTVKVFPTETLEKGTTFRVVVDGVDRAGNHLEGGVFTFTTVEEKAHAEGFSPVWAMALLLLVVIVAVGAALVFRRMRAKAVRVPQPSYGEGMEATYSWPPIGGAATMEGSDATVPREPAPSEGAAEGGGEPRSPGGWEEF